MFDVAPTELIVLGTVALLVIPPKDLPRAMRMAGYWVGRARGVARQFRSGFDNIVREAELEEMERRWRDENERIMREHPPTRPLDDEAVAPDTTPQPALIDQTTREDATSEPMSIEHPVVTAADGVATTTPEPDGAHRPVMANGKASS